MGILDGKVAAVTGAGRGIGQGVAKAMAAHGAAVVVNDLGVSVAGEPETKSPADDVVAEIRKAGGKAASNHLDIATMAGGKGLVDQARRSDAILAVLQAEREALIRLRDEGQIDDEVLRTLQRELDLEESRVHTGSVVAH